MNLLINEPPLQVLPSLAVAIGLNEAIVIQQMHYWIRHSKNVRDDYKWVYKKFEDWHLEFPFWSMRTLKRIVKKLEDEKLIISSKEYNKMSFDHTKWYRVNYEKLNVLSVENGMNDSDKMAQSDSDKMAQSDSDKMAPTITKEYTENTTEKNNLRNQIVYEDESDEMILVDFFIQSIRKNSPTFKMPNKQKWADVFRKIIYLDNREKREISELIRFVQNDDFEKANVLSPEKIRKRYDQLLIKMNQHKKPKSDVAMNKNRVTGPPKIDLD